MDDEHKPDLDALKEVLKEAFEEMQRPEGCPSLDVLRDVAQGHVRMDPKLKRHLRECLLCREDLDGFFEMDALDELMAMEDLAGEFMADMFWHRARRKGQVH